MCFFQNVTKDYNFKEIKTKYFEGKWRTGFAQLNKCNNTWHTQVRWSFNDGTMRWVHLLMIRMNIVLVVNCGGYLRQMHSCYCWWLWQNCCHAFAEASLTLTCLYCFRILPHIVPKLTHIVKILTHIVKDLTCLYTFQKLTPHCPKLPSNAWISWASLPTWK